MYYRVDLAGFMISSLFKISGSLSVIQEDHQYVCSTETYQQLTRSKGERVICPLPEGLTEEEKGERERERESIAPTYIRKQLHTSSTCLDAPAAFPLALCSGVWRCVVVFGGGVVGCGGVWRCCSGVWRWCSGVCEVCV